MDGDVAGGVTGFRAEMPTMEFLQLLSAEESQPQIQRHLLLLFPIANPSPCFDVRFLNHIRGVNPSVETLIHAKLNHPPQPFAMRIEQRLQLFAGGRLGRIGPAHDRRLSL